MERLTGICKGRYGIKTSQGCMPAYEISAGHHTIQIISELQKGLDRLAAYETTGLSPEQLLEMDRLYSEKCREVAYYKKLYADARKSDWITVEERLPEPNADVMVSVQEFGKDARVSVSVDCILDDNGKLPWGTYCNATERVLAWKALPEPYRPEGGKPPAKKKVAYSLDNEHYYGCFDTDSEACTEALKEIKHIVGHCPGDVPEFVYIGSCEFFEPTLSGAGWDIIEAIQCQAYDNGYGEYAEGYLCVSEGKRKELEAELGHVFRNWVEKYNLHPDFYTVNSYDIYKYDAGSHTLRLQEDKGKAGDAL